MSYNLADWETFRLGDLATYVNGRAFRPSDWKKSGMPIVRIQNLTNPNAPYNYFDGPVDERFLIDTGDLLISWSATLGSFIWDRGPAILNQHIFKVLPNNESADKEFLHYLVLNTLDKMATHAHGIAMKHITKRKFESLEVKLPPLPEQRRIVTRIKECMERVDEIERLRAREITEAQAALPSLLNETFVELAEKHSSLTIDEASLETRYGTSNKCSSKPVGTAVIRIPNVADGLVNLENLKYCPLDDNELTHLALQTGDLLFVRTNGSRDLVGRCAIFESEGNGSAYAYASYLIRVRLDQKKALPHYLAFFLNSTHGRIELNKRRRTSAGQFNINSENLKTIAFPAPPIETQRMVIDLLQDRQTQIKQLQRELSAAQNEEKGLRESILRKAFAGEL